MANHCLAAQFIKHKAQNDQYRNADDRLGRLVVVVSAKVCGTETRRQGTAACRARGLGMWCVRHDVLHEHMVRLPPYQWLVKANVPPHCLFDRAC
jgi:hypothetical protein